MGSRICSLCGSLSAAALTKAAAGVLMLVLLTSCGDTFRPVANPIPQPGGDPAGLGNAIILSANTGTTPGTASHINVSGDTVTAVHDVGANPVHAILLGSEAFVANQNSDSLTVYLVTSAGGSSVTTITLPSGSKPTFVNSTDNTNVYVAEQGTNAIGVVSLASLTAGPTPITDSSISAPVAIAELPNASKIYVANAGGQVTVIDPATLTVKGAFIVGSNPQAIVASADNNCVYVANQGSNTVSVIKTATDPASPPTTAPAIAVGTGPKFLLFDNKLQRVYVANNGGSTISIINHAADCSTTTATSVPVGPNPQSITALADGTRAYVANSDGTVTVINTSSNTVRKTISAGTAATVVSIGSSTDGVKVFVANNAGSISVIRTSDDSVILQLNGTSNPKLPGGTNPQFVLMF